MSGPEKAGRAAAPSPAALAAGFVLSVALIGLCFAKSFQGIQGDGMFYYSYTVSLLWDGDLDLQNQFDWPDPAAPGLTVTRKFYALDETTGRAFCLFNPGTGVLMLPGAAAGRLANALTGKRHSDPFDPFFQRWAAFTAVILSALTLLLLYAILGRFVSPGVAVCVPALSLAATNWLFYATAFASWSHVYALFLCAALAWSFLRAAERPTLVRAILVGLAGGLFFSTRNFSILLSLPLLVLLAARFLKKDAGRARKTGIALAAAAAGAFLLGAAPQLVLNSVTHGSPLRTAMGVAGTGAKVFGFPESVVIRIFDPANLEFLYSNLWNSENGLFYGHLFFLTGLIGALIWTRRDPDRRRLLNTLLLGVYALWFVDAGYFDNWINRAAGSGFGHRRFLDVLPLFVLGAASLLEWGRARRGRRLAVLGAFALLGAAGLSLTFQFLGAFPAYAAASESFGALYRFLLLNVPALAVFAVLFLLLLAFVKPGDDGSRSPVRRSPLVLSLMVLLAVLPAVVFRPDAAAQRARFGSRRGFFLMYDGNPLVRLPARSWGLPAGMARPMLAPTAEIGLPAPLEGGDLVLLSLTVPPRAGGSGESLEVSLGGEPIGRAALGPGKQVARFPVPPGVRPGRILTLKTESPVDKARPVLFHEGRIVLKEDGGRPFGKVELPREDAIAASGPVALKGWALADKGLAKVYAALISESGRPGVLAAEARFGLEARPDIEGTYVLYPGILEAGWTITLDRKALPPGSGSSARFEIVAVDNDGRRAVLGRRKIFWRD